MKWPRWTFRILFFAWMFLGIGLAAYAQTPDISNALALEQHGKTAEAAAIWKAAVAADPSNASAQAHLGLLEARMEQYSDAVTHYKAALALKPDMPGLQMNLGLALFKAGRFPEAIASFTAELHKHPGDQRLTIFGEA